MANISAKNVIFTWILCAGGCRRKIRSKKENSPEFKTTSHFGESWSCIRCLLKRKDSYTDAHYKGDKKSTQYEGDKESVHYERDKESAHYEGDKESVHHEGGKKNAHYERDKESAHYEGDTESANYEGDESVNYEEDKESVHHEGKESTHYEGNKESPHYERDEKSAHYEGDKESAHYEGNKESAHYEGDKESAHYEGNKESAHYEGDKESAKYEGNKESADYEDDKESAHYEGDNESAHYEGDKESAHYEEDKESANYEGDKESAKYEGNKESADYEDDKESAHYEGDNESAHYEGDKESAHYEEDKESANYEGDKESAKYEGNKESADYEDDKESAHYEGDHESAHYEGDKGSAHYDGDKKSVHYEGDKENAHYEGNKESVQCEGDKESQQGSEATHGEEEEDCFFDLLSKVQSHRLDDQRCQFSVISTNKTPVSSPTVQERLEMVEQRADSLPRSMEVTAETAKQELLSQTDDQTFRPSAVFELNTQHIDDFNTVTSLGTGAFGRVELVTLKADHARSFALKIMQRKGFLNWRWNRRMNAEGKLMKGVDCPFVARMFCTFKDRSSVYMVMEACLGGDLHTLLRHCGYFENSQARFYAACVLLGLEYLHTRGIAHRDIKPENLLLDSRGYVKLGDFGAAKQLRDGRKMRSNTGTLYYQAPEIFVERWYDQTVDFWALGVTIYQFLSGSRPFVGFDPRSNIMMGFDAIGFPPKITNDAKDLIRNVGQVEVYERLGRNGVAEIKDHKWFKDFAWADLESQQMTPPFDPQVTGPTDCHNFY